VIRGEVSANGKALSAGDAVAVDDEKELNLTGSGTSNSEVLLFDLA